jgi:hypothetical protein
MAPSFCEKIIYINCWYTVCLRYRCFCVKYQTNTWDIWNPLSLIIPNYLDVINIVNQSISNYYTKYFIWFKILWQVSKYIIIPFYQLIWLSYFSILKFQKGNGEVKTFLRGGNGFDAVTASVTDMHRPISIIGLDCFEFKTVCEICVVRSKISGPNMLQQETVSKLYCRKFRSYDQVICSNIKDTFLYVVKNVTDKFMI